MRLLILAAALGPILTGAVVMAGGGDDPFATVAPPAAQVSGVEEDAACDRIVEVWAAGDQGRAEEMAAERVAAHPTERRTNFIHAVFQRSRFYKAEPDAIFSRLADANDDDVIGQCSRAVVKLDAHKDIEAQFRALQALVKANRKDPMVVWLLGIECREHHVNTMGAEAYRELCTLVDPGSSLVHQTYANILDELGRYREALEHRHLAVKLEPAAWSYNGLGNTLHSLGRYEEAVQAQTRAIEMDPESARIWRQAARSENARGRYESALKMAQRSAELEGDDYWTWMEIGTAQEHLGRTDEAMDAYQRAISISPGQCAAARAGVKRLSGAGK